MSSNFSKRLRGFYEKQYKRGETKGPRWYQLLKPFTRNREEVVFSLLSHGDKLLDVGCGEGWLARKASLGYREVVGIDIALNRLEIAKKRAEKEKVSNLKFSVVNFEEKGLPFKNEEFDVITCLSVLEYFFDPYFAMDEFYRVLKEKGILIIEVPNIAFLPERIKLLLGKLPGVAFAEGWAGGRLHNFTMSTLEQLFIDSGFQPVKKTGSGFLWFLRNWRPSLLCGDVIIKGVKK
jgi:ubiquinone/menaquinone biosynthesis C-methylase UbiE